MSAKLNGGDTTNISGPAFLPEQATVQVIAPAGNACTGNVIDRGGTLSGITRPALVLTAAHCFCVPPGQNSAVLTGLGPNTGITIKQAGTGTLGTSQRLDVWVNSNAVCDANQTAGRVSDLAIVTVNGTFPVAQFPTLPRVYTGGDFTQRLFDYILGGGSVFPPGPWLFVGHRFETLVQRATFTNLDFQYFGPAGPIAAYPFVGWYIRAPQVDYDYPFVEPGDSGGALTFGEPSAGRRPSDC